VNAPRFGGGHKTKSQDRETTMSQSQPIRQIQSADTFATDRGAGPWARLQAAGRHLIATTGDKAASLARVALGLILFPHGAQHALGWFGGHGFGGTFGWMTRTLGFPAPLAALAIVTELLAPLALVLGLGSRLAAAGLFGLMVGAIKTHAANGFFMNWFGAQPAGSEGFEYHLLVMAVAAVVMIKGGGTASVDRAITRALTPSGPGPV
jgi:putative oxidoreductase